MKTPRLQPGTEVRTSESLRPDRYAGKLGVVISRSADGEYSVEINSSRAFFLRRELTPTGNVREVDRSPLSIDTEQRRAGTPAPTSEASLIREWGRKNGWEPGTRGRLNPKLIEAYHKEVK